MKKETKEKETQTQMDKCVMKKKKTTKHKDRLIERSRRHLLQASYVYGNTGQQKLHDADRPTKTKENELKNVIWIGLMKGHSPAVTMRIALQSRLKNFH